uniref:S1 motif domain-containing protein n=1 Tax=Odontella aurita TaxID=265563 RepID=A0A7S4IZN9_9STRA
MDMDEDGGGAGAVDAPLTEEEEEEAMWIMGRVPEIAAEFFAGPNDAAADAGGASGAAAAEVGLRREDGEDDATYVERRQRAVVESIVRALRCMKKDKLEPGFIRRYRKDVVNSPAVRSNLYNVMDEDAEWDRLGAARLKVEGVLDAFASDARSEEAARKGKDSEKAAEETLARLKEDMARAQEKLDETLKEEERINVELEGLKDVGEEDKKDDDDDDDDELFGDDDDDDDDEKKQKKAQKSNLQSHLTTVKELLNVRAESVAQLTNSLKEAEERAASADAAAADEAAAAAEASVALESSRKMCRAKLWNMADYSVYLSGLTDVRHVSDVRGYLGLLKEGNDAVRAKGDPGGAAAAAERKKRSRRFDRDYYRTCVSEGLRAVSYRFLLAPFRVGIKLEDNLTLSNGFQYDKTLPGDDGGNGQDGSGGGGEYETGPRKWVSPVIPESDPTEFASDLVGSGELVLLSTTNQSAAGGNEENDAAMTDREMQDPLRGCRYVAAMELAYEPRVRRHLRSIYRARAVLSTRPTKRGSDNIDAFHEHFGLHLLRDKPIKEHFPMEEQEREERRSQGLSPDEQRELDEEVRRRERDSCVQYLNLLKAEAGGDVRVHVHLPFRGPPDERWYDRDDDFWKSRDGQNLSPLLSELERVYLPPDGDADAWNDERKKVLRMALTQFLLPQFESETRRDLRDAAVKVGSESAAESLRVMAMEGPYRPSHLLGENRFVVPTRDLPIVGVCVATDSKEATFLAAVTNAGEMGDHLAIPSGTRVDGDKMREKVVAFLMQNRPAAVVVGTGGGLESRTVARKLGDLLTQATERWNNRYIQGQDEDDDDFESRLAEFRRMYPDDGDNDDDEESQWKCNVDLVDDNVPQLFGRSIRGKKEFPDAMVNLKVAVSVARHAKDPLGELSYTYSVASDAGVFGTEMLFLNVHPLQQLLPKTLLLRKYERVLCDAVAEVGVDVNAACHHDHLHGLLSFVPGLGPRKANSLRQSLVRIGSVVSSRKDLLQKRLVGPVVYNNAVAFLRVRETEQLSGQYLHPLDDTRLHPDVYHRQNWAVKIAIDALELGEGGGGDKDDLAMTALRDVMEDSHNEVKRLFDATKAEWESAYGPTFNVGAWDPKVNVPADSWQDKVEELDLDTFAEMIEQRGEGRWLSHLLMIKWEFRLPFEDPRKPMEPLGGDKLFRLLTGETDSSLRCGREVTGKVVRNGDFGSRIKLEGNIPGFVPLRNLADEHVESAEEVVSVGQVITCVITEVKKDHMCVDLSLKKEDMRKLPSAWERPSSLPPLDGHFDAGAARRIEAARLKEREERLEALELTLGATRIRDGDGGGAGQDGGKKKRTGRLTRRACAHPAFRNAKHEEVDGELRDGGDTMVGEALVRPSSKIADSLALHWMVRPGAVKVFEVTEEDKDTDASIGNKLKIKNEVYGSIDEILGRFIAPMNDRVEEVTHHRKFLDKLEDDLDDVLRRQKKATPSGIFYNLCWNEQYPGYLSLRFIMSNTPRNHIVSITPEGYGWGKKTFSSMDRLLNEFKKNPRGVSSGGGGGASQSQSRGASSSSVALSSRMQQSMSSSRMMDNTGGGGGSRPSRWGAKSGAAAAASTGSSLGGGSSSHYGGTSIGAASAASTMTSVPTSVGGASSGSGGGGRGNRWGAPAARGGESGGWNNGQRQPPPPSMPPPPARYGQAPPSGPPPSFGGGGGGQGQGQGQGQQGGYGQQQRPPPPPPPGYPYQQPPPPPGAPQYPPRVQ